MLENRTILTFGLTAEQNDHVRRCVPVKGYVVEDVTDAPTDLNAVGASVLLINDRALDEDTRQSLISMYNELEGCFFETVIWFGKPGPPKNLRKYIKCFDSYEDLANNLKYCLLSAHSKMRSAVDFSKKLSYGIKILALIRKYPGISTQELSDRTELSIRTVQRYITALQVAGEWIEYDVKKHGWQLQYGISIFYEDHMEGENVWTAPEK